MSQCARRREINSKVSIIVNNFDAVIINVKAIFVSCYFYTFVGKPYLLFSLGLWKVTSHYRIFRD